MQRLALQLLLRLLPIGHVGEARDDLAHTAVGSFHGDGVDEEPAHVSVGADHSHHHVADRLAAHLRGDVRHLVVGHERAVLADAAVLTAGWLGPGEQFGRTAEDAKRRGVREHDRTGRVAHDHAAGHRVIDRREIAILRQHPRPRPVPPRDRDPPTLPVACQPAEWKGYRA